MTKPVPHILIAAARKSSGKTSVSLGLARALTRQGLKVQTFKKGPDYIDPLWLEQATGRPCYNLDFNSQTPEEITALFDQKINGADIAIIETNKGLFDGIDVTGADSNAQLAKLIGAPIVLVLDTVGMTRGIAPLLHGYQTFDPDISIDGIILNKTGGPRHEGKLIAAIEQYNQLDILGSIPRRDTLSVDERHLGLTTPGDVSGADPIIDALGDAVEQFIDLEKLKTIAQKGARVPLATPLKKQTRDVKIAIPRDEAFGFYYPDDLEALEAAGAELVFFNALRDQSIPHVDGLFIGGGFPETNMEQLSQNSALREQLKSLIQAGLPTYAECGGLMYLCDRICWDDKTADMVGIINADVMMNKRPQGRGIAHLKPTQHHKWMPLPQRSGHDANIHDAGIHGANIHDAGVYNVHEFHFASLVGLPDDTTYAYDVKRGYGIDGNRDGIIIKNMLANFCHLRQSNSNRWAENFVNFVRQHKND